MTKISMDVSEMRALQKKIIELQNSIQRITRLTNTKIYGMAPHWQSTSANIFFDQYNEAAGMFSEIAELLGELATELNSDIDNWEDMAQHLSS